MISCLVYYSRLLSSKLRITLICFYAKNLACISGFTESVGGHEVLSALIKFGTKTVGFVISVRPSVRPHGTTRLPLDLFSLYFIFEGFFKISLGT
jgi:hypothetical protein